MKRRRAARSSTVKRSQQTPLAELEQHLNLLLQLVQHNLDKVFRHKRSR